MSNLLYNAYKKRYFVATDGSYNYSGSEPNVASFYADLQPNTTYTIKRYDSTNRFRIATYSSNVSLLTLTSSTSVSSVQHWVIDSNNALTFTTGDTDIHLVAYYTNASQYSTRVMLNEGDTIEEYEAPTLPPPWVWRVENGKLTHPNLPPLIQPRLSPPYPPGIWYVENGRLTHSGLPETLNNGAFADCESLRVAKIPQTVRSVGEQSFMNTALTAVTISRDCEFSDTSFPPRCIINYYT